MYLQKNTAQYLYFSSLPSVIIRHKVEHIYSEECTVIDMDMRYSGQIRGLGLIKFSELFIILKEYEIAYLSHYSH